MGSVIVEALEPRRLLSGGLTASSPPAEIASGSGFASTAICAVGSNHLLVCYVVNQQARVMLTDLSFQGLSNELVISSPGQQANPSEPIAAVQDSNGNVAVVFGVSGPGLSNDLYLVRVSGDGSAVGEPVLVASKVRQARPSLAAGPDGAIGIVFEGPTVSPGSVMGGVFDASGNAVVAPQELNAPNLTQDREFLNHPGITWDPASQQFFVAWTRRNYSPAQALNTEHAIDGCEFSLDGQITNQTTIVALRASATSNNIPNAPFFFGPAGQPPQIVFGEDFFGADATADFQGSGIFTTSFPTGGAATTPASILTTAATRKLEIASVSMIDGHCVILYADGTYSLSGFAVNALSDAVLGSNGAVAAANVPLLSGITNLRGDPVLAPGGIAYTTYSPSSNTSTILGQPTTFTAPSAQQPDVHVDSGKLIIQAQEGNNTVALKLNSNGLQITVNGKNKSIIGASARGVKELDLLFGPGDDSITIKKGSAKAQPLYSVKKISVRAGDGDNRIVIGAGLPSATLVGGDGNDTIIAQNGQDKISAGGGNNLLAGGTDLATLTAGNGNNTIYSVGTRDSITVGNGINTIYAGPGDQIKAGAGKEKIFAAPTTKVKALGAVVRKPCSSSQLHRALQSALARLHL